jgi:uncharacterized protein YbaA (DUF1428 family)
MPYVDGFLLPVAKNKVQAYRRMAQMAGRVWRKYGALEFRECVGDDLNTKMGPSFKKAVKASQMRASDMPMDPKRMYYGGFKFAVAL